MGDKDFFISAIYVKCTSIETNELWRSLTNQSLMIDAPWCIEGDFNVISDTEEKFGGSKYTWCNNRKPDKRIWKRLNRTFLNDSWIQTLQNNIVRL
ncbi:hypothetical protein H5410_044401 [Solanum commersonii]|uniref:Uncharacterized protein n=1 Tax=Solanum commersonii TaxID=4109 RepID=A0A9J5X8E0_SOLCO|nr:hypothetical protein H5410_044401 [Solanum commersonii]